MKKFFPMLLMAFALFAISNESQAQSAIKMSLMAGDTIVNTGTASKILPRITGGYAGAAVQVNIHKLSGTGAGTVKLMGSLDGVTYTIIGSAYTITDVADQATVFYASAPLPGYLKILSTGSGTESVVQTVWYRLPKYQNN